MHRLYNLTPIIIPNFCISIYQLWIDFLPPIRSLFVFVEMPHYATQTERQQRQFKAFNFIILLMESEKKNQ